MTESTNTYLECCLYFTANSLGRVITRIAEEEFQRLGMSPSHAFLLMLAIEEPGISQKGLAGHLNLAQSTVSRFADSLVARGYLEKRSSGKEANVYPTEKGREQLEAIQGAWHALYERYSAILGKEKGERLTRQTFEAYRKLNGAER